MSSSTATRLADDWAPGMRTNTIIVMLALAWLGVVSAGKLEKSLTVSGWQAVPAAVLESRKAGGGRSGYYPRIRYRYEVRGVAYVSDDLDAGVWSRPSVETVLARYPAGATVTAYVNPLRPSEAVLQREAAPLGNLLLMALGLGGAAALFWYRFIKRHPDAPDPRRGRGHWR